MLSYRHGFHAGNHADVLKHLVQVLILDYMQIKPAPVHYIDTHAGAGMYDLAGGFASKNREYLSGIDKLRRAPRGLGEALKRYLAVVELSTASALQCYPGSPAIALSLLRPQDRATLFELHPRDCDSLIQQFYRRARIELADGFTGLPGLLPPKSRRALVLIDPPYEDKDDYLRTIDCLKVCQRRFSSGVYALWYPLLPSAVSQAFKDQLIALSPNRYLYASLQVKEPTGERGMFGSAMFVINPPWGLEGQLTGALPTLAARLGEGGQGRYELNARLD